MSAAILTDVTKCIGCRDCVMACKSTYGHEQDIPRRWSKEDGLSAISWTSIVEKQGEHIRKQCRHCLEPACASACPVGALHKTAEGPVVYDSGKCLGCRYCMMACPYGIPRYDWGEAVPYVRKCVMCHENIKAGKQTQPSCTEACPVGATIYGERDELIAEAHKRIKDNPGKYIDKVWGEHEIGGTGVLYISNVDLSFLTYGRPLDNTPLPARTRPAMHAVLPTFGTMVGTMAGLSWIIKRRIDLSEPSAPGSEADRGEAETKEDKIDG